jgi:hypothetical protein
MFVRRFLIGRARILCWLLRITENGQTHQQCKDRSKSDSLHTSLLMSVTSSRAKLPKSEMPVLSMPAISLIPISRNNLGRGPQKKLSTTERTVRRQDKKNSMEARQKEQYGGKTKGAHGLDLQQVGLVT